MLPAAGIVIALLFYDLRIRKVRNGDELEAALPDPDQRPVIPGETGARPAAGCLELGNGPHSSSEARTSSYTTTVPARKSEPASLLGEQHRNEAGEHRHDREHEPDQAHE